MRKGSILFLLLIICTPAYSQRLAQLGPTLGRVYPSIAETDEAVAWIYFIDKGTAAAQKLSMPQESFLSTRAIQRRARTLGTARVVDMDDLPLEATYVRHVASIVTGVRHEAKWFNAMSVVATKEQIEQIRQLPFVREVDLVARLRKPRHDIEHVPLKDRPPVEVPPGFASNPLYNYGSSLTQNQQINTVAVHNLGITGQGVLIGILDDSFPDLIHPALATRPIIARYDFVYNDTTIHNNDTHGQETFSTIGGFAEGNLIGPAFGASFVLARTEQVSSETPIEEDNWVRGIIWADSIGIDVSSCSLGYDTFDAPWPGYTWQNMDGVTAVITRAADRAASLGIVVVNSAGNSGDPNAPNNSLGAPADGFNVITAGAVSSSGARASFSSVGPTVDGRIKPDVMAMGLGVTVAVGTSGYSSASGTSFSCPLSAGVAALVLSGNLNLHLTPFQVREAMRQTASRASNPDRLMGWGILNALNAVNYAWIEHAPLTSTEDTTARTVLVRIKSRIPLVADSTRVVYGIGGSFTSSAALTPTGNPNEYSAQIPYLGAGANVTYYIKTRNANVSTRSPLSGSYGYQVGTDPAGPTIVHRQLGNQAINSWPPRISAVVTDLSGVDSVKVQYRRNGIALPPVVLPLVNGIYSDTLHISRSQVQPGDTIAYRIIAADRSRGHNVTSYPPSGDFAFAVVNCFNLNTSFDDSPANFIGTNDWQWGAPAGQSPRPHGGARVWGTVLNGNYTQGPRLSSLTTPLYRVFSNRATFSFWHWHEIQSRFDGGNVKISTNRGAYQTIRPIGDYPTQALYTGYGNPLAGQPGYSSVGGNAWAQVTFDLAGIVNEGDSISFRFDFGADNAIQYRGWYIDDVTADGIVGPPPLVNAALGADRDTVNFGSVTIGQTDSTQSILVRNMGQATLNVTGITISNPAFRVSRTAFSLNFQDTLRLKLSFTAPTPGGVRAGSLTFVSNSNPPPAAIQLLGTSVGQARLTATPDTMYFARLPGSDTTRATFRLTNAGSDTLRFRIDESLSEPGEAAIARSTQQQDTLAYPKGTLDPRHGDSPLGSGGPDAFGYRWADSDEPGGPQFNWADIVSIGTPVTLADDANISLGALGFTFNFYGTPYTSANLCSNGWLSFTSTSTSLSNTAIPASAEPNAVLYGFWDDLNPATGGTIHYYRDAANGRFVVQFTNVPHYGTTEPGTYTFQIILNANGTVLYQYLNMQGVLNSSTIGIESGTGTIGLQTAFNTPYVHNNLAVLFSTDILTWASVSPATGSIAPGDSATIQLRIHPAGLLRDRLYAGRLRITGNTPDIAQVRLGLSTFGGLTVDGGTGTPATFALEQNYPNPFNPSTSILFSVAENRVVSLKVFDMLGKEVATLVNEVLAPGRYRKTLDASRLATGVYYYRLEAGSFVETRRMILLK